MQNSPDPRRYEMPLLAIGIFCLPIKLSFSYCIFIPLVFLHIFSSLRSKKPLFGDSSALTVPLVIYFSTLTLTGLAGLNPLKSIPNALSALGMVFLIPLFAKASGTREVIKLLTALIAGQTLAGVHSVLQALNAPIFSGFFVGQVTESGQLALTLPALIGVIGYVTSQSGGAEDSLDQTASSAVIERSVATLLTLMLLTCCFSQALALPPILVSALLTIATVILLASAIVLRQRQLRSTRKEVPLASALLIGSLPILITTFVVNLKRGPWAGALAGLTIYLLLFRPRTVIPIVAAALIAAATIIPIRNRIMSAPEHFYISGGRSEIWDIGAELISTYPLGIGFKNSSILGKFSTDIPHNLRHFHSNPINIAVESGMIGLLIFYWWIGSALYTAYRQRDHRGNFKPLVIGIACALISWQIAGLVEYNVGDSEVLYIAYALTGLLAALSKKPLLAD